METISEAAEEEKNLDEVSDKVSSLIQRDASAAMSASTNISGGGTIGVWSASSSASLNADTDLAQSNTRSTEIATRRLREMTRRASERITRSYTLRVRDILDITTSNTTRRVIKNETSHPVSYGIRRVYNRILVKVQAMGPHLVWQLYVREPGRGLRRSKFVHFRQADPVTPTPMDPPAVRPRPTGGSETAQTSTTIWVYDFNGSWHNAVTIVIRPGPDRIVTGVSIDTITDMDGGGKGDRAPAARNDLQSEIEINDDQNSYTVIIAVMPGDSESVQVGYTYTWEPSQAVFDAWEEEKAAAEEKFKQAEAEARQEALREQFERTKEFITERSKIRPRPASDLRREERYEIMNRMVSHLFRQVDSTGNPGPLDIEYFHLFFDVEAMFVYVHPSWWEPRYASRSGIEPPSYEITAESDPAPLGSSLGWLLQLDGDARRNEILNSPWARVCIPIRPSRERAAIEWLADHVEGDIGYDPQKEPLKSLLEGIENLRQRQAGVGVSGPDYVKIDSSVGSPDDPAQRESVFPIVDEFEVTVPTEGFVYDDLRVTIP